jgi:hypothetical protein
MHCAYLFSRPVSRSPCRPRNSRAPPVPVRSP